MYGQQNQNAFPYNYSPEFQAQLTTVHPPLILPIPDEHDSLSPLRSELSYTSSGCYNPSIILRNHNISDLYSPINSSSPSPAYPYIDLDEASSLRRPGDLLHGMNMGQRSQQPSSPSATESSILESMSRASPYSPEEKKERIERYRSKRNLRNFNKKIKYECRKTLADSRPRIRGRFARNEEIEKTALSQWDQTEVDEDDEDETKWINLLDAFSANMMP